jgi:hypothetical protein
MASRNAGTTSAATPKRAAPNPISPELALAPFADGGLGALMLREGYAYLADYVLGTDEGPDHDPTEFERWMLEDFLNGLMGDDALFGPVRRVLLQASAALGLHAALRGIRDHIRASDEPDIDLLHDLANKALQAVGTPEPANSEATPGQTPGGDQ